MNYFKALLVQVFHIDMTYVMRVTSILGNFGPWAVRRKANFS